MNINNLIKIYTPKTKDKVSIEKNETKCGFSIFVPHRTNRYLDEFISLTCSVDLLKLKVFPNAKEVTESFACFNAIRKLGRIRDLGSPNIHCLIIGDGHTPRTGATIAFRSNWKCYSIDPNLNIKEKYRSIKRLNLFKCRHDAFPYKELKGKEIIVIHPHSHAPFHEVYTSISKITDKHSHIVIPCCETILAPREPDIYYEDNAIYSPKRKVFIWK